MRSCHSLYLMAGLWYEQVQPGPCLHCKAALSLQRANSKSVGDVMGGRMRTEKEKARAQTFREVFRFDFWESFCRLSQKATDVILNSFLNVVQNINVQFYSHLNYGVSPGNFSFKVLIWLFLWKLSLFALKYMRGWAAYWWWSETSLCLFSQDRTRITAGFLICLLEQCLVTKPCLVVVPASLLVEWKAAFHKWIPTVTVVAYTGSKEARRIIQRYEFYNEEGICMVQIALTSFDILNLVMYNFNLPFLMRESGLLKIGFFNFVLDPMLVKGIKHEVHHLTIISFG